MLTIDWQKLGVSHGYATSDVLADAGIEDKWHETMEEASNFVAVLS